MLAAEQARLGVLATVPSAQERRVVEGIRRQALAVEVVGDDVGERSDALADRRGLVGEWLQHRRQAVAPPSTGSATPVTNDASSDSRNSAAFAISAGCAGRPVGLR